MWTPDPELARSAIETIDAEVASLTATPSAAEHALGLLEAAGTLAAMAQPAEATRHVPAPARELVRARLADLQLDELDDATVDLLQHASRCLTMDDELLEEELGSVLDALRARDRVELAWLGAETLALASALSSEAVAARDAFDEELAPLLWQLLPLGTARTAELAWMSPDAQARFWWRSRGAELPANALDDPRHRVAVLREFPEAKPHLDKLAAFRPRDEGARLVTHASLGMPLDAMIASARAAALVNERGQPRALAAGGDAGAGAIQLARNDIAELSVAGGVLIVDVLSDVAPGAVPALVRDDEALRGVAVEGAVQRYEIDLSVRDLDGAGWRLIIPLVSGIVELAFDAGG